MPLPCTLIGLKVQSQGSIKDRNVRFVEEQQATGGPEGKSSCGDTGDKL